MLVLKHHVCGTVLQQPWETNTHSIQALLLTASTALPANPTDGLASLPGTLATVKTQLAGRLRKWDIRLKRKSPHILQLADEFETSQSTFLPERKSEYIIRRLFDDGGCHLASGVITPNSSFPAWHHIYTESETLA